MGELSRAIRYLRANQALGLRLRIGGEIRITAFIDCSFACHMDKKSHTGCEIFIGDFGPVYTKSSRQIVNCKSAAEAELVGAVNLMGVYLWIRKYLISRDIEFEESKVFLQQDNQAVLSWIKSGKPTDLNSRHLVV